VQARLHADGESCQESNSDPNSNPTVNSNRNPTTNPNVTLTLSNVQRDHVDTHHEAISNQYERPRCRLASARLTVQAHIVTFVNKLTGLKGVMDRCKK